MKTLRAIVTALILCAAPAQSQTLKSLMYNTTNGQVVANTGTNWLTFTNGNITFDNAVIFLDDVSALAFDASGPTNGVRVQEDQIIFAGESAAATRTNLGLGATNNSFSQLTAAGDSNRYILLDSGEFFGDWNFDNAANFQNGISSSDNIVITNQSTATNGLLFVYRTNNEPFLGLANLIASNNVTVSNETLFRVGVSEATNKAAQFGFRSTNTNGNGVAVFSVFGFNALMQIGADASTNAVIFSGGGTNNEVMTLIKNGATEFARPIAFSTTAHAAATRTNLGLGAASDPTFRDVSVRDLSIVGGSDGKIVYPATNAPPADTTNVAVWIQLNVGTNSYRVPLYQ